MNCFPLQIALYIGEPSSVEIPGIRGKSFKNHSKRPSASKHYKQYIKFGYIAYIRYPNLFVCVVIWVLLPLESDAVHKTMRTVE